MALFLTACGGSGGTLPLLPPDSSLTYSPPPPFTVTMPITPVVPTHTVNLTNFSIIPNLPAGLTLDPGNGVISGTPTQVSPTTTYTVSVQDGTTAITTTIVITVNPLPAGVSPALENALAGPTMVIRQQDGWNTYSSVDGTPIAHLDIAPGFAAGWALAIDGSYLLFAGTEGVQAITPQGTTLFRRPGDYLTAAQAASFFAAPDEVRVANGPAGAQVIENIAITTGAVTISPAYLGNFAGWFVDGEKFLSAAGNTVRVYSRNAVPLDRATLPSIEGLAGRERVGSASGSTRQDEAR